MTRTRKPTRQAPRVTTPPTLHDALGTEPATSPSAAGVARVAALVGPSAYEAARRHLDSGDPIAALTATATARAAVDVLQRQAVAGARGAGATWAVVGQALGMTRQAAQQRFGA